MYERTCVEIYGVGVEFSTPQENFDAVRCSGEFVVVCKADPTLALQFIKGADVLAISTYKCFGRLDQF